LNLIPYPGFLDGAEPQESFEGTFWAEDMTVNFIDRSTGQTTNSVFYSFSSRTR